MSTDQARFHNKEGENWCGDQLHRKILVTAKCKFNASIRLKMHHIISQWTIALISVVLICTPLVTLLGLIEANENSKKWSGEAFFAFIQVTFAILILVYSLLISSLNLELKSYKFHLGGVEIKSLLADLRNADNKKREKIEVKYNNLLKEIENHADIDFLRAKFYNSECYYKNNIKGLLKFLLDKLHLFFIQTITFIIHLAIPGVVIVGVYVSINNNSFVHIKSILGFV